MNVRLSSNQIRFRITSEEYATLCASGVLEEHLRFADRNEFTYAIVVKSSPQNQMLCDLLATCEENRIVLHVREEALQRLAEESFARDGLVTTEGGTKHSLEIDIRS